MKKFLPVIVPKFLLLLPLLGLLHFGVGCASVNSETQDDFPEFGSGNLVTISALEREFGGDDPCENFNRAMFAVTDFGMCYIADPLGRIYCTILPRPLIECIDNFCLNLEYPARVVGCLLQAEWRGAGDETVRFLCNSTLGIGGLFDPARHWFNFYSTEVNFGQTFAAWGIGPGCTFILPFSPALNIRDNVGLLFDTALDGKTYIPYCGTATFLNRMTVAQHAYAQVTDDSFDPYKTYRPMALLARELKQQLWNYRYLNRRHAEFRRRCEEQHTDHPEPEALPPETPHALPEELTGNKIELTGYYPVDPYQDSLRSIWSQPRASDDFWFWDLSLFNRDFVRQGHRGRIRLNSDLPAMRYRYWEAPESDGKPAAAPPLVFILPGIGGVHTGRLPLTLSEICRDNGYAVVTLDSTFNWNSYVGRDDGKRPGFPSTDAALLRRLIAAIRHELEEKYELKFDHLAVMGYSFGAIHTLKIAAQEAETGESLGIERFLAINPPVSLAFAMAEVEKAAKAGSYWSKAELQQKLCDTAGQLLAASQCHLPPYDPDRASEHPIQDYRISIDAEASRLMAALSFQLPLRELLAAMHKKEHLSCFDVPPDQWRRDRLYREIDRISFRDYAEKILALDYPELDLEELYRQCDLRSEENFLRTSPKVRVLHNYDDFLLSDDDRAFLDRTLGQRLTWFSVGGHLGNLYDLRVQQQVADAIALERN